MKLFTKNAVIRFAAIVLVLSTFFAALGACSENETRETSSNTAPVLELDGVEIPLFFYEFMLSRVRADLARNGHKVTDPDFWYSKVVGTDKTYEQYYNEYTLETCKAYIAAEVIFEREGLSLPESTLDKIDEDINFYIGFDGDDDEEAFNKTLRPFGVDTEALRRCYIIEAKYEYLLNYLYGGGQLIGDTVKEEYYQKNFVRFKQILFTKYKYEYERDFQGNIVYYDIETGLPVYDTEKGKFKYNEEGNYYRDTEGQIQYFDENGVVIYDTEKGRPAVKQDEKGNDVKYVYTAEENAARLEKAEAIASQIKASDYEAFEKKMAEIFAEEMLYETFKDGYYLSKSDKIEYVEYPYINVIVSKLETMNVGDIAIVETEEAYHIIMRYELDEGKYLDEEYESFFESLTDEIISDLFENKISGVLSEVTVNEENLKAARSITRVGTNYDY